MKIFEIFKLLKDFSAEDNLEFEKFLNSPFHNENKVLVKLFQKIQEKKVLLENSEFKNLIQIISRDLKYSPATTKKRISLLGTFALNYLKLKSIFRNEENTELIFDKYLLEKKYLSFLKSNLEKTERMIYNKNNLSEDFFRQSFNYFSIRYDYQMALTRFSTIKNSEKRFVYLNEASSDLALYYLIQQIIFFVNYVFLSVNSGKIKNINFPLDLKRMIQEFDKSKLFVRADKRKIIFDLYKFVFFAFYLPEGTVNFLNYKRYLSRVLNKLDRDLIKIHFDILLNYCLMKERLGEDIDFYRQQQTRIILTYIEKDYFRTEENKHLHSAEYRNFILIAFSVRDFNSLKFFIDKCTSRLNKKDRDDMLNLGLAFYYYGIKNYDEALTSINKIEINSFIYRFDIRNILLRVYYETDETEKLMLAIHNYHKIISDDKILDKPVKNSLRKMLKYLNKLIIIKKNPDSDITIEAGYLLDKIQKEPTFALKKWFVEVLEGLISSSQKKQFRNGKYSSGN